MTFTEMMTRLGMTWKELSERIHVSEYDIKAWVAGEKEPPEYVTELIEKMIQMKESGEADICHRYHVSADIYLPPMTLDVDTGTVESELRNFLGAYAKVASIKVDETGREKADALEKAAEPLELSKKLERKRPGFPDREEAGGKPKTLKKMRKKAGMTRRMMSLRYNISEKKIKDWESGKEPAPLQIAEMLKKAVDRHVPRTQEEIMRLPLTVIDLKLICDMMIREGYGERSVLLSNDTNESGYHGIGVAASLVMIIAGSIIALKNGEGDPLAIALIMSGCVIVVAPALIGVGIEVKTGYYKCTECGHFYKPSSFLKTTLAMHMNTTRYMRCLSAENAVGRKKC